MYANKHTKGYVALITTLVVGSVATLVTVGMLTLGTIQTQSSGVLYDGVRAGALADACVEYALQEIRDNTSFSAADTEALGSGECNYKVSSNGGESRTVYVEGFINDTTRRIQVEISDITPVINITSWNFVQNF